jgi:class 3 adenylate cyclase
LQELCHSKEIAGSPFFNVFHRLSLSVFRPEEALELVEKPSLAAGCPLAPYAPSVFRMGGYFPFFLQLACCAFFEHCSSKPNHPAPDLTAVWGAFYDEARSHFEYVWDHLSDRERVVALKLSNRQRLEEADRPFLHSLVRRGYARDGENFLFSDVFDAFVQAKAIAESHPVSVAGAALTDANTPEQLLQERRRIDDILRERFLRQVAVLYVDVVGSTQFSENRGPVEAFNLIKRLEVLLQPIIRKHGGRVVKLAGDAVIARFDRAPDAVRAGMAVQKEMARHNARLSERDQTRVKVAINYGEAIEVESDVYGDAINAAERVLRETAPDEVLISEFVHRRLSATDAARFVEKGSFALKGKAEPVRLYSYQHQHQR